MGYTFISQGLIPTRCTKFLASWTELHVLCMLSDRDIFPSQKVRILLRPLLKTLVKSQTVFLRSQMDCIPDICLYVDTETYIYIHINLCIDNCI